MEQVLVQVLAKVGVGILNQMGPEAQKFQDKMLLWMCLVGGMASVVVLIVQYLQAIEIL